MINQNLPQTKERKKSKWGKTLQKESSLREIFKERTSIRLGLTKKEVIDYMVFCKKVKERRAQKKIYFWWIPICYDMEHKSGCGQRMAQKNVDVYKSMMNN